MRGKASYDLVPPHIGPASKYPSDTDAWCLSSLDLQVYFTLYSKVKASTYMMASVYLLCVYSSHSQLVLYNIPNSLMTAIPLSWHNLCSRVTALGGAAVRC